MRPGSVWRFVRKWLTRPRRGVRGFDQALEQAGGMASRIDRGVAAVPTEQIVGSVNRWQNLRSDFLYRTGTAMTRRFRRIGEAMQAGKMLPPVELYKLKRRPGTSSSAPRSEYFVLDGHHRVAMARRLGQDFLDAHVIEYQPAERPSEMQLAHALRRVQLLRHASADDLVALWRHLHEERVAAGEVICHRGERGERFYIVQTGSVEVRLGTGPDSMPLYRLGPGECFGEMALLSGEARSADVVALEDSVLWALERSDFDALLNASVPLLRALNRSIVQRLSMATVVIDQSRFGGAGTGVVGLRFGPYRVVSQLGAGGMAVVYSAVHEDSGTAAALKVLPASWGNAPELKARLNREGAILRGIEHPGVIRVLEVGNVAARLGGGTYVAMEWLPDALDRLLCAQSPDPLQPSVALRIAGSVAEALGAVHASGLIHRDLKPSNILLRADGQPVLTDFGLAAALADTIGEHRLTPPNMLLGTADYLAPEVIAGQAADARSDLYALGVVLYEMLAGFVPFAGRAPLQTLRAQLDESATPLPATLSTTVRLIVERALQKDPRDRFQTAEDMARAIRGAALDAKD
jgi:Protein kinase domain/Cyclic nucleotide-binding domain